MREFFQELRLRVHSGLTRSQMADEGASGLEDMEGRGCLAPGRWFEKLFGFNERADGTAERWQEIKANFELLSDLTEPPCAAALPPPQTLKSLANNKKWRVGTFGTPTLGDLRRGAKRALRAKRDADPTFLQGKPRLSFEYGDVAELLVSERFRHASFQVASQFNCLEFVSPRMTPEDGIAIYEGDRTQGPACSIACAPATVVRNYFAQDGQNAINTLQQTLAMLEESRDSTEAGSSPRQCVQVKGGYTFPTSDESLSELRQRFEAMGVFRHGKAGDNDNPVDLSCLETPSGTRSCTVECKMIPRLIDHRCLPDDA